MAVIGQAWAALVRRAGPGAVDAATARRLAGDWRGACAAVGWSVDVDLDLIAFDHGQQTADRITAGLHVLAPDLVHQYLPRPYSRAALTDPSAGPREPLLAVEPGPRRLTVLGWKQVWQRLPVWCWRADAVDERLQAHSRCDVTPESPQWPDLQWLLDGQSPDALHPLIHTALFPGRTRRPYTVPWEWPLVRVRCRSGTWHEVHFDGGRLTSLWHTAEDLGREPQLGCARALRGWRTGRGWIPRPLRLLRARFFSAAAHGTTDVLLDMIHAGFDPGVAEGGGGNLAHYLGRLDTTRIWPWVCQGGAPLDALNGDQRTPLEAATLIGAENAITLLTPHESP